MSAGGREKADNAFDGKSAYPSSAFTSMLLLCRIPSEVCGAELLHTRDLMGIRQNNANS